MKLSNKTYDALKWIARKLPAVGTFFFAISEIWGIPYGDKIVGSIAALATLLCSLLDISSKAYHKEQEALEAYYKDQAELEELSHDSADD